MSSFTYNKEDLDTFALAYGVRIPPGFDESMITGEHSSKTLEKQLEIVKQKESILTQKLSQQKIIEGDKQKEILALLGKLGDITDSEKLKIVNNLYEKVLQYSDLINKLDKLDYNSQIPSILSFYQSISRNPNQSFYNYVIQEYSGFVGEGKFTYNKLKPHKILVIELRHFHTFVKKRFESILKEFKSIEIIENTLEYLYEIDIECINTSNIFE